MVEIEDNKLSEMEAELETLRPLKDSSAKLQEEFKTKEEAWNKEKSELQQQINPNWQKARVTIDRLTAIAKEKGVQLDGEGNVVNNPNNVDMAQVRKEAAEAAKGELINSRVGDFLSGYEEKSAQLVKHFYDKLTTGESVTMDNIGKFISQAEQAARVELGQDFKKNSKAMNFSGGSGPRQVSENKVESGKVQSLADKMQIKIKGDDR